MKLRGRLDASFDAVKSRGEYRRVGEIRIRVPPGKTVFDAQRRATPDNAESAGPIVPRPDDIHRRPRCHRVALVRIDVAGNEDRELARPREQTTQKMSHGL